MGQGAGRAFGGGLIPGMMGQANQQLGRMRPLGQGAGGGLAGGWGQPPQQMQNAGMFTKPPQQPPLGGGGVGLGSGAEASMQATAPAPTSMAIPHDPPNLGMQHSVPPVPQPGGVGLGHGAEAVMQAQLPQQSQQPQPAAAGYGDAFSPTGGALPQPTAPQAPTSVTGGNAGLMGASPWGAMAHPQQQDWMRRFAGGWGG